MSSSSITIDGFTMNGTALEISALFNAVSTVVRELAQHGDSDVQWLPIAGTDDAQRRVAQMVRIHTDSSINTTIVDEMQPLSLPITLGAPFDPQ